MVGRASDWKRREAALGAGIVSIEPTAKMRADLARRVRAVDDAIAAFFRQVEAGTIYNEFSLQHELGIYLRSAGARVQFERPVGHFLDVRRSSAFVKKEIDMAIVSDDQSVRIAIELKYPRNGQYPEQMFKFCQDICFLEELVAAGFSAGFFVVAVEDRLFHSGPSRGIYAHFRGGVPVHGSIRKPTGDRDETVDIRGSYTIEWRAIERRGDGPSQYACVEVTGAGGNEPE